MFDLSGKVAVVTGGSRGIGRAVCVALAAQGAHVVVGYAKGQDQARAVVEQIHERGGRAEVSGFDVADWATAERTVVELGKRLGRLDILVASAGIAIDALLLAVKEDDLDRMIAVNLKGAIACAQGAFKVMMRKRTGRVVFLSSVVGEMGNPGQVAYGATKAALLGVTKSLAHEFGRRNVTVNAVAPGFIETDMTREVSAAARDQLLAGIPLKRLGTSTDVAGAVVYLCSDEAAYVTGQTLRVNGGMYV
ncbi:MAG: 3-oxoacyl-ACP reductase FabG [Deltaproteobacteria bacterium]|nr:3-oxoacyl-ACP reductase FabG [Deltaproteobacteria bacterium]